MIAWTIAGRSDDYMNLLDIIQKQGHYRRTGIKNGGEWAGPCPLCGGHDKPDSDRFHVWPHQGKHGTWWCRRCDQGGDAIQYLRDIEGKTYRDACAILGEDPGQRSEHPATPAVWTPRTCPAPSGLWQEHAAKLPTAAPDYAWLSNRGITANIADHARLAWNETDQYRQRAAWGLPAELKDDGTPKKLWIPQGLVIPYYTREGRLLRLRIRRPHGEPRYYVVPGSSTSPYAVRNPAATGEPCTAAVIVESELDALTLAGVAPSSCAIIAMGNSTARPDDIIHNLLAGCKKILVSLDTDPAGRDASPWWTAKYKTAERYPIPGYKDPGEAAQQGFDLAEWLREGLPPVCYLPPPVVQAPKTATECPLDIESLYDDIRSHEPHGASAWLRSSRPDVLAYCHRQDAALDAALDAGTGISAAANKVRLTWMRAWTVYRDALAAQQQPAAAPPPPESEPVQQALL